jgi:hypothetical protein
VRGVVAVAVVVLVLALGAGCGIPSRVEGTVRYRDAVAADGSGGQTVVTLTTVTTTAMPEGGPLGSRSFTRSATTVITDGDMAVLLRELDRAGLFGLGGRSDVPPVLPPGAISVDTDARRFSVALSDLRTAEDATAFSTAASRIVVSTQLGAHYQAPK